MTDNLGISNLYENDISEVAQSIRRFLDEVIQKDKLVLPTLKMSRHAIKGLSEIILTGSGQSFYTAQAMAHNTEMLTDLPTYAIPSALLKGTRGVLYRDALVIAISQSGENADTISAVKRAMGNSAKVVAVTAKDSTIAKMCKSKVHLTDCDTSLCTFQNEYLAVAMLSMYLGEALGCMSKINTSVSLRLAQMLPGKLSFTPNSEKELQNVADFIGKFDNIVFCGYSTDEALAQAIAEKFRLIAGKTAFALPIYDIAQSCLELKNTLIVPIVSNSASTPIVMPYIDAIKYSSVDTIIYTPKYIAHDREITDGTVTVDDSIPLFNPITLATVLQQTILELEVNTLSISDSDQSA